VHGLRRGRGRPPCRPAEGPGRPEDRHGHIPRGRRDAQAVAAIAALVGDPKFAATAVRALGTIGTADAAKALADVKVPDALKNALADSTLLCADNLCAAGKGSEAAPIYRKLYADGSPLPIRIAALRGLVLAEPTKGAAILIGLMDEQSELGRCASRFVIEVPGSAATKAFADALPNQSAAGQVRLLTALTARADKAAAAQVTKLATSKDETVRIAALQALAVLGDASSVPVLARAAGVGGAVGDTATLSLNKLKGEGVSEAMARLLDSPDPAFRAGILQVMTARNDRAMAPAMLKAATDKDENVRKAALKGLDAVAGPEAVAAMVKLLCTTDSSSERSAFAKAIASAARRTEADIDTTPIVKGLDGAKTQAQVALIGILGKLGGETALTAVRASIKSREADVVTEAVRALCAWPDDAPADDLVTIIKTTDNKVHRVLAFRGYMRMATMPTERTTAQTMAMYKTALGLAKSVDEKKSVLSGLADARSIDALALVQEQLASPDLRAEAELACVQVASNARDAGPEEARAALKAIIASTKNDGLKKRAQGVIAEMDKNRGFIRSWLGCGPYTQGNPFDTAFAPEKPDAKGVAWKPLTQGVGPQVIDLEQAIGRGDNRTAYAKTYVFSPKAQDVRIEAGSDDGIKIWIGGKVVHANNATRPCRVGEDKAKAKLAQGWNPVLVKIAQGGGQWAFCLRITRPDGAALEGLRVSTELP